MEAVRMARAIRFLLGTLVVAVIVGLPLAYGSYRHTHFRNLRVVKPGLLYRSGQLTLTGWERVINDYGIKTVVSLRDARVEGKTPPDAAEETYCRKLDINYLRLPPQKWWTPIIGGPIPAEANVKRFLQVMDDPANYPVLIHCFAGIHRTGQYVALYRMEYDHWDNDRALDEMRANGYDTLDDEFDVLEYLQAYRPRWKQAK
jgi:tyrosine-protein phosphatase SIW14